MWIRSAFWTGQIKSGFEDQFVAAIDEEIIPALAKLPGVLDVKSLWPRRLEDNPPAIACQILVTFNGEQEVDRMLASPERLALRGRVREVAGLFDGTISHIDYSVGADAAATAETA